VPESYPTPLAGQRITASLLRSMLPQIARKTADTQRSATTTTVADPHLTFEVVANGVYTLDGWLKYDGPTAGDISIDFSAPVGSLGEWTAFGVGHSPVISFNTTPALVSDSQQSRGYTVRTETTDVTAARSYGTLGTGGTPLSMLIYATLRVGSTAGTYSLDWAQSTSDAGQTTIYTDSWLRLQRIA